MHSGMVLSSSTLTRLGNVGWDLPQVRVFQGADGSFNLFEDDGASLDYRNGNSSSITFSFVGRSDTNALYNNV